MFVRATSGEGLMATGASNTTASTAVIAATAAAAATVAILATSSGGVLSGAEAGDPTPADLDAARLLNFATFGATAATVTETKEVAPAQWVKRQADIAFSATHFIDWYVRRDTEINAADPKKKARASFDQVQEAFWAAALAGPEQLRTRMAFALSEICVVSFQGSTVTARMGAAYFDMLRARSLGTYRDLIEAVSLSPAMGTYLNIIGNIQADNDKTRRPDENYAREIMQLMSIGLYQLNMDGSAKLDAQGAAIPTYGQDDIAGLAKIFTGWGFWSAKPTSATFAKPRDVDADIKPLMGYTAYHSQLSKTFLGASFPAYSAWTPPAGTTKSVGAYQVAGLKFALDTLANHPNTPPFMARRLIQRFVKSNPSPAYIERVAKVFVDDGAKVRGNLTAVIAAVLSDPEAWPSSFGEFDGKLREPILRLSSFLRAFSAASESKNYRLPYDFSPAAAFNQAPLMAPSVFNFWMPDFAPLGSAIAKANKVAPEFQGVDVLTTASYANKILSNVQEQNWGNKDVTTTYARELALTDVNGLVDGKRLARRLNMLLFGGQMGDKLAKRIIEVVGSTTIAKPTSAQLTTLNLNRVRNAVALAMVSTDFLIQR
ncbi:DUF1800 domain-containing protein [Caulobacter vibrioides]|uniref:DUF1800 domain-containing protein n=2 Tax=Caulobacter vibrioides TaxID=155892 RepID=Q9A5N2_CAUVC|nr:DUF1800 family protein [Caulobacter vibrioides]YP_002517870.1 DUF1800 family protein [Caulobacter vibrioides NA1000]AAK24386.1 hypothetical protein CC_2415 [Caulobacter vibrioides CB15]ACL95962.1 DUF1800 family protein [Caulobacter vibrioides NA1000]ATC29269.1 DUF1800 domain-containing protein [Caulobacter vibrioides]QXZ50780.1 DUF1800 family protein [Caulobacter vibrioides]